MTAALIVFWIEKLELDPNYLATNHNGFHSKFDKIYDTIATTTKISVGQVHLKVIVLLESIYVRKPSLLWCSVFYSFSHNCFCILDSRG